MREIQEIKVIKIKHFLMIVVCKVELHISLFSLHNCTEPLKNSGISFVTLNFGFNRCIGSDNYFPEKSTQGLLLIFCRSGGKIKQGMAELDDPTVNQE